MAGVAPPVYPTQIPAPARLRYALHYHGRSGEAELTWHRDDQRYRLQLRGLGVATDQPPYKPLVEQSSEGAFDAAGLAPDRFTDRRRGRGSGAANFRRDTGRITFSGPANSHPAWPGAQDRLSWLAQVTAISAAAANSGPPLGEISIFVAGARGGADLWRFVWQGAHTADTPLGLLPAQHWRREALQPDSQQVDLWLDPARGHWPVLLRYTALRTGARFELQLAAEPGPAPRTAPRTTP